VTGAEAKFRARGADLQTFRFQMRGRREGNAPAEPLPTAEQLALRGFRLGRSIALPAAACI